MSTTIDEKVVEMRFDNRDFEKNIKDTMKTLDEFKKQLNFSGASNGLENVGAVANKLNFNNLSNAIDTVNERFSTLGIIGIRVLENITDRAMQAGERIVRSLTITPITDGLREYELQIGSTQTIMANTGESVEVVNEKLDELNEYADLTIYNFSEMTRNVGTFTAALGKGSLEQSTEALKGIGNWAAYAGASSEDMARAAFQLSQGLSAGSIRLRDWMSIEHTAGMSGANFQEAFAETARDFGINVDAMIEKNGSFRESLKEGWLTTDVFMETMKRFANDQAMTDAATKIKTFSQLVGVIKEALGTGWAQTWRLIIGDFEQAKETFTRIGDFLTGPNGIITRVSDARNELVKSAMGKTIGEFAKKFKDLVEPIEESADSVKRVVDSVQDYTKVVDEIISGKWGNGQSRWDALTKAGYDWAHAQNLVNERLGSSVRHAENFSEKQEELVQSEEKVSEATKSYIEELVNLSDAELKAQGYNDEQIKDFRNLKETADKLGLSVTELIDKSDKLNGRYMLIESFANVGRALISIFSSIGKAIKDAFPPITADTIFNIITGMYRLSNIIKNYVEGNAENLTRTLRGLFSILSVVANIIKGVLRIGFTILGGILSIFGKTTSGVLSATAELGDMLTFISTILNDHINRAFDFVINLMKNGIDVIRDFIFNNDLLGNSLEFLKNILEWILTPINNFITENKTLDTIITNVKNTIDLLFGGLKDLGGLFDILINKNGKYNKEGKTRNQLLSEYLSMHPDLKASLQTISSIIDKVKTGLSNLGNHLITVGKNMIDGLIQGIKDGSLVNKIVEIITNIANRIKEAFCKLFGIASPSTVFFEYGKNIIEGLFNGLKNMFPKITEIFNNIYESIKNISFSQISSILLPLTSLIPQLGFLNLPRQFANLFNACGIESLAGLKEGLDANGGVFATISSLAQKVISKFKEILGIASPSKVFIALGGFIMAGLAIGLKQGFVKIPDTVKGFADKIIGIFKNIDFGKILAVGVIAGSFLILKKAIDIFKTFVTLADRLTAPLKGLGDALSGLGKMFTSKGEAAVLAAKGNVIKAIAESILMIAAAMFILSKIENIGQAAIVVGVITAVFIALFALMSKMSKNWVQSKKFIANLNSFSNFIKSLAACMLILSIALKIMGGLSRDEIDNGTEVILKLGILVGGLVFVTKFAGKWADRAATFLSKIGGAFIIMAVALKILGKMSLVEIGVGLLAMAGLTAIIMALVWVTKFAGEYADKASTVIAKVGAAFLLLAIAMKILGGLQPDQIDKGCEVLAGFVGLMAILMIFTNFAGDSADKAGQLVLSVSAAFLLLGVAMKILGNLSPKEMEQGGILIAAFTGLVMGLIWISKFAGKEAHKAGLMILEVSAGFVLLSAAMKILGSLSKDEIIKGIGIIAAFTILVGALIGISAYAGKDADKAGIMILKISFAIAILTGCLIALTFLDTQKMLTSLGALCTIIGVLGVAIFLIGQVKDSIAKAIPAILLLGILSVGITAFLAWLNSINAKASIETASALSEVLLAMSVAALVLSKIQFINPGAITSMFILGGVVAELAIILGIMDGLGVKASVETATSLSILLVAMSGCLVILAAVGAMGAAALTGAMNLIAVVSVLGLFIGGLGALVMLFSELGVDLENFINNGGKILSAIGKVIGEFIGSLIDGFNVGATNSLPEITKKISESMNNLEGFISGANNVKSDTVKGAGYLAAAILELTAAEFISGILAITPNIIGMVKLGFGLSAFIKAAGSFFEAVTNINPKVLEGTKNLADAILALTKAELIQGIMDLFGLGDKSLAGFGEQLGTLGSGLNDFIKELTDFGPEKVAIVDSACQAIKTLAEANKSIPNEGGLLGKIVGENSFETFGTSLKTLGTGLNDFVGTLKDFTPESVSIVDSACQAIQKLGDANKYVANTGGFVSFIIGDNDLGDFGLQISKLGNGLAAFVLALRDGGFDSNDTVTLVDNACKAVQTLAGLNQYLGDDKWFNKLIGNSSLETFANEIPKLATGINNFVLALPDFGTEKLEVVKTAVDALLAIGTLGGLDLGNIATNMNLFSISLEELGVSMGTFFTTLTEIGLDVIQEGIGKVNELVAMASTIAETNIEQVSVFSDSLVKVANEGVTGFCNAFEGVIPKQKAKQAVIEMMKAAISGAESKRLDAIKKFEQIARECLTALEAFYKPFYDMGGYLTQGFADGIRGNIQAAIDAATEVGKAAAKALADATQEQSPSKLTRKMGVYFSEGFAIGIKEQFGKVYDTAFNTGDMAKEGLSNAIAKISQMVEDGIDTSPTIRPVLDLSEVEQGASYLGSMFGTNSVGLRENINAISNGFNSKIQNGSGLDLLNAINKLEATVRGSNGNTLNIYTQELDSEKLDQIVRHVNKELGVIF